MVKVRGPNSNGKTVKQTVEKMAHVSVCDVSGAASQSCKAVPAIWNVHDQPESLCRRPAVVNLLHPVVSKNIPQPRMLDTWHQWCNTGRVFITQDVLVIFGRQFDCVPVRILASDLHHRTLQKKSLEDQRVWFWSAVFLYLTLNDLLSGIFIICVIAHLKPNKAKAPVWSEPKCWARKKFVFLAWRSERRIDSSKSFFNVFLKQHTL